MTSPMEFLTQWTIKITLHRPALSRLFFPGSSRLFSLQTVKTCQCSIWSPPASSLWCCFLKMHFQHKTIFLRSSLACVDWPFPQYPSAHGINPRLCANSRKVMWRSEINILYQSPLTFLERVSQWTWHLPFCLDFLNNKPYGYPCLGFTGPWVDRHVPPHLASWPGFWGSKLRSWHSYLLSPILHVPWSCQVETSGIHPWWIAY